MTTPDDKLQALARETAEAWYKQCIGTVQLDLADLIGVMAHVLKRHGDERAEAARKQGYREGLERAAAKIEKSVASDVPEFINQRLQAFHDAGICRALADEVKKKSMCLAKHSNNQAIRHHNRGKQHMSAEFIFLVTGSCYFTISIILLIKGS